MQKLVDKTGVLLHRLRQNLVLNERPKKPCSIQTRRYASHGKILF